MRLAVRRGRHAPAPGDPRSDDKPGVTRYASRTYGGPTPRHVSVSMLYYFAYGSNLHPMRLQARIPSARLVGMAELPSYRLAFHKRSVDLSGKCNLVEVEQGAHQAYGAVYTMKAAHKTELDRIEGSGYSDRTIEVTLAGRDYRCFTYIARDTHIDERLRPYHWYRQLVLVGALFHRMPPSYVAAIERIDSIADPDAARQRQLDELLRKMQGSD